MDDDAGPDLVIGARVVFQGPWSQERGGLGAAPRRALKNRDPSIATAKPSDRRRAHRDHESKAGWAQPPAAALKNRGASIATAKPSDRRRADRDHESKAGWAQPPAERSRSPRRAPCGPTETRPQPCAAHRSRRRSRARGPHRQACSIPNRSARFGVRDPSPGRLADQAQTRSPPSVRSADISPPRGGEDSMA